ncbi:MAG: hypothetical protein AAF841_09675 [Pseudomonadota bacterium]
MAGLALGALTSAPLAASDWFQHPFGELRAFHQDWLVVCAEKGRGACRAVRAQAAPGSDAFFDQRVSLKRGDTGWHIELMQRDMPERDLERVTFRFAREEIALQAGAWVPGERAVRNVAETITLTEGANVDAIIDAMRAGRFLEIGYEARSGAARWEARARVPLRGLSAAMAAIETHLEARP